MVLEEGTALGGDPDGHRPAGGVRPGKADGRPCGGGVLRRPRRRGPRRHRPRGTRGDGGGGCPYRRHRWSGRTERGTDRPDRGHRDRGRAGPLTAGARRRDRPGREGTGPALRGGHRHRRRGRHETRRHGEGWRCADGGQRDGVVDRLSGDR